MTIRAALLAGLISASFATLSLGGCKGDAPASSAPVATLTVDATDALLASGKCQVVDANGAPTRQRMGVIPGATLLTDYEQYAVSELPADKSKTLVFYCANEHCGASHVAAERALTAGYTDVKVLPAGIAGWRKAGKSVQQL
jgi:rhodanese-related sulfurtransferase